MIELKRLTSSLIQRIDENKNSFYSKKGNLSRDRISAFFKFKNSSNIRRFQDYFVSNDITKACSLLIMDHYSGETRSIISSRYGIVRYKFPEHIRAKDIHEFGKYIV